MRASLNISNLRFQTNKSRSSTCAPLKLCPSSAVSGELLQRPTRAVCCLPVWACRGGDEPTWWRGRNRRLAWIQSAPLPSSTLKALKVDIANLQPVPMTVSRAASPVQNSRHDRRMSAPISPARALRQPRRATRLPPRHKRRRRQTRRARRWSRQPRLMLLLPLLLQLLQTRRRRNARSARASRRIGG